MKIGQWLMQEKGQVPLKELSKRLDVSVRTLHNWRSNAERNCPAKIGRPRHSEAIHKKAIWLVGRELRRQGYPGWRAVSNGLKNQVPDRLIQLYVQKFKLRRRKRQRSLRAKYRVRIKIKSKNVLWTQDGTHLGRHDRKAIEAQIIKDRSSQKIIAISTGSSATSSEVIDVLERLKHDRGLPLVWSTDNGSMYVDKKVSEYLQKEKIIHLKSLPQTPEHNGAAEIGMREIKSGSNLGKGRLVDKVGAHKELIMTVRRLNDDRLRASLNYQTASEVDQKLHAVYTQEVRDRFYDECCNNMNCVGMSGLGKRNERLEIRNVVLAKLQEYGFIEIKRGDE